MVELINKISKGIGWYGITNNCVLSLYQNVDVDPRPELSTMKLYDQNLDLLSESTFNHISSAIQTDAKYFYIDSKDHKFYAVSTLDYSLEELYDAKDNHISSRLGSSIIVTDRSVFDQTITYENPLLKTYVERGKESWTNHDFGTIRLLRDDILLMYTTPNVIEWNPNLFSRIEKETGNVIWSFDFTTINNKIYSKYPISNTCKLLDPIGTYENQIWFPLSDEGLLCLDYYTGEFKHFVRDVDVFEDFSGITTKYPVVPWSGKAVLLPEEGKIVCLHTWYYWELNLNTLEIEFSYLRPYFEAQSCWNYQQWKSFIIDHDQIIGVSQLSKKLFSFNRRTKSYNWIYDLPEGGKPRAIERHGDKLYVDTFSKELLVLQIVNN